jgi:mRNA interferase RelE/StbE
MKVEIDDKAIKDLSKIDKKEAIKILNKIENLQDFPQVANIKRLTNFEPPYRLRVGNYRVLFELRDDIITVYRVKHRSKVYE